MLDSFSFEVEEPCPTMGGESCRFDQFFLMRRCGQLGGIRSQAEKLVREQFDVLPPTLLRGRDSGRPRRR